MAEVAAELDFETVIVGAGISGIGAAIELKKIGLDWLVLLESAEELGGTWRDNTYPGVAVDIPSISYCYSFEMDHTWSASHAPGSEIQTYLKHCSAKYDVDRHIRYNSSVDSIEFRSDSNTWVVHLRGGDQLVARYVIAGTGILSQPKLPKIEGIDSFEGKMMHTARWDHDYAIEGKTVGIIGTGASAVQVVPTLAPRLEHIKVFQRTPVWMGPRGSRRYKPEGGFRNTRLGRRLRRLLMAFFLELATLGATHYQRLPRPKGPINAGQARHIRGIVRDREVADRLIPEYGLGCKRPGFSNHYLQSFNRDNVSLVTDSITRITPRGIETADGVEHALDAIIMATGFKTMERGNAPSFDVFGLDGLELGAYWHEHRYQAFWGVSVPRFPNFFLTSGPYSGGLNWFGMLEAHTKYIGRCMLKARKQGSTYIEVKQAAHDAYFEVMQSRAKHAVFTDPACRRSNSYYIDHHGDASLPYPMAPLWRWFKVRLARLAPYRFEP